MRLSQALRLDTLPRIALVGSGGKSTALFKIGSELIEAGETSATVLLTATTHMSTEQLGLANTHIVLNEKKDFDLFRNGFPRGLVLLTGPEVGEGRTKGLTFFLMQHLLVLGDQQKLPILIEADGSRQRPLKAPSDHEPVIPGWVEMVIVVCGLSGLGKPLESKWVHRPEIFANLASLSPGDIVTPEGIRQVMINPIGGLKGIPVRAKRVALLNQADTEELQAAGNWLAGKLLKDYHSIIIASLAPWEYSFTKPRRKGLDKSSLPLSQKVTPDGTDRIYAVHESVAGIILAAGGSNRMGKNKQVLTWRGEPMVRHVALTALAAGLSPVVVVTGSSAGEVESALRELPVSFKHNPNWESGQSSSVIVGLQALPPQVGAAVFLLADQPQVPAELVRGLVETHAINLPQIVAPQVMDQRANPVLFDRKVFPDLLSLTGDVGGRILFSKYPITWVPWYDNSILLDVDTLEDYQHLLEIQ